jgi:hypothetical protein
MTLTIRIANIVRRNIPITEAQLQPAAQMISAALPILRSGGPVAVTLTDGNGVVQILHKD